MTRRTTYDEAMKESAFAVWLLEADRNCVKTARILSEIHTNQLCPSHDTIQHWAKNEQWDRKAQRYLAERFPDYYHRFHGRLLLQQDRQLAWSDALFQPGTPEFDYWHGEVDANVLINIRQKEKTETQKTLGSGMYGQRDPRVEMPPPPDVYELPDGSDASPATTFYQIVTGQLPPGQPEPDPEEDDPTP